MKKCTTCKTNFGENDVFGCPNCGAKFCPECAKNTKRICPYCYSSLEYCE